jgi:hypothetical protein
LSIIVILKNDLEIGASTADMAPRYRLFLERLVNSCTVDQGEFCRKVVPSELTKEISFHLYFGFRETTEISLMYYGEATE